MRALTDTQPALRRALCSLGLTLVALGPAAMAGTAGSPYRLQMDPGEYRLRLPGLAQPAAFGPGKAVRPGRKPALSGLIERHARARGLDPDLVHAVVRAESAYRPDAVSPKGAIGLMQVMPATGRRFGVTDLASPDSNLRAGTAYLGYLLELFEDLPLALAAYNAGEGAVLRHGKRIPPYPETQAYVRAILRSYGRGPAAAATAAARRLYLPGVWLDRRDLSPYRLRKDPWRDSPG